MSVFSDVTSPLLTESLALVDNAQRMRATFLAGLSGTESTDEVAGKLKTLNAAGRVRLDRLRQLRFTRPASA